MDETRLGHPEDYDPGDGDSPVMGVDHQGVGNQKDPPPANPVLAEINPTRFTADGSPRSGNHMR